MSAIPQPGDRLTDRSKLPDDGAIRNWIGEPAFTQWTELRHWIDDSYPAVFSPEWLYGGQKKGWSLRYKKTRAFCTLVPEYQRFSAVVVLGGVEREKFEDRRSLWRPQLVKLYEGSKIYPDGLFLSLEVSSSADREELMDLLTMKRPPTASR